MTHPTDDELEAMAVRLDQAEANEYSFDNDKDSTAAMLRACKGRDARTYEDVLEDAAKSVPQGWCQPETSHIEMHVTLCSGIQAAIRAMKGKNDE